MITLYDNDMRTIVDIPEQALRALDHLCKRERISRAEAIRRAVNSLLKQQTPPAEQQAFGLWKDRNITGTDYEDRLRDEWAGHEPGS